MNRREFTKLSGIGLLSLGFGSTALLAGCEERLADTTVMKDKSTKAEKDTSGLEGEPTVSVRFLATEAFTLALPALQESYSGLHGNVVFDEPTFVPSAELVNYMEDPQYDGIIIDLQSVMTKALESGVTDKTLNTSFYSSNLGIIASPDMQESIAGLPDLANAGIEKIVIGDPSLVFSAAYANQALYSDGLYSEQAGTNGVYDESLASKVEIASSLQDVVAAVKDGSKTVGFVMCSEALVFGQKVVHEIMRTKHRNVFYQGAALLAGTNMVYALDFLTYCSTETEAEKVADTYQMPL